jgi:cbb3-type cytochrome oxidase maturation protein
MEVLIYLVPLALGLGLLGLGAFLWALNSGQFDDLDGAAWRAIMDDDLAPPQTAAPDREPKVEGADEKMQHGAAPQEPQNASGPSPRI